MLLLYSSPTPCYNEYMNAEQRKERYANDPKYRENERARARERYQRLDKPLQKRGPKARSPEERFWEKVVKGSSADDCWDWTGSSRNGTSHASLSVDGRPERAARLSWKIHNGELTKDQYVRLSCKNPLCANPSHLYLDNLDGVRNPKIESLTGVQALERRQANSSRARKFYEDNKESRKTYVQEYQMKAKIRAINYLGGKCQKCGFDHPSALQFHHRNPATKTLAITSKELSSPKKLPWDTVIVPELNKCDLLCSNCHFLYHAALDPDRVNELKLL